MDIQTGICDYCERVRPLTALRPNNNRYMVCKDYHACLLEEERLEEERKS